MVIVKNKLQTYTFLLSYVKKRGKKYIFLAKVDSDIRIVGGKAL
jgi:hypothetical protein